MKKLLLMSIALFLIILNCGERPYYPTSSPELTTLLKMNNITSLMDNLESLRMNVATFSPSGNAVLLNRYFRESKQEGLVLIRQDSVLRESLVFTPEVGIPLDAIFSPDSGWIALSLFPWYEIMLINTGSSENLPIQKRGDKLCFSPDGRYLFYREISSGRLDAYDLDTGEDFYLSDKFHGELIDFGIRSPEVGIVAVFKIRNHQSVIQSIRLDSLQLSTFGILDDPVLDIALSPSGNFLVYTTPGGRLFGFSLLDSTGFSVEQPDSLFILSVDWASEGKQIVFTGGFFTEIPLSGRRSTPLITNRLFKAELLADGIEDSLIYMKPPAGDLSVFINNISIPVEAPVSLPSVTYPLRVSPPVFTTSPNPTAHPGREWVYYARAQDADLFDQVIYTLIQGPPGMQMLPHSGILVWTPPSDISEAEVVIEARDSDGNKDRQMFRVIVE